MVRLSYWERIEQSLPEALKPLLLAKPEARSRYAAAIAQERDVPGTEVALAQELMGRIKSKQTSAQLEAFVAQASAEAEDPLAVVRVTATVILILCSKSLTHLVTLLQRFKRVVAKVATGPREQQVSCGPCGVNWGPCSVNCGPHSVLQVAHAPGHAPPALQESHRQGGHGSSR
jgi:nuclear cap-binding protein subunit 1